MTPRLQISTNLNSEPHLSRPNSNFHSSQENVSHLILFHLALFLLPPITFISATIHTLFGPYWTEQYYLVLKYSVRIGTVPSLSLSPLEDLTERQSACILLLCIELYPTPLPRPRYVEVLTLVAHNGTLFGIELLQIQLVKVRLYWSKAGP